MLTVFAVAIGCGEDDGGNPFDSSDPTPASDGSSPDDGNDGEGNAEEGNDDEGNGATSGANDTGDPSANDTGAGEGSTTDPDTPTTTSEGNDTGNVEPDTDTANGGDVCAPAPSDGDCNMCTKAQCCAQLTDCDGDETCNCIITCADEGGNPNDCQSSCGGSPLFDALTNCVIGSCLLQCV